MMATRKKILWVINIYMDSIVTVTCTRDKWSMALQSHSLNVFVDSPCNHFIIINDDDTPLNEWEEILRPLYSKHRLFLITRDSHPYVYPKIITSGWHDQQVIKFLAYQIVTGDRYLILDSKNIFIKKIELSEFVYEGCGSRLFKDDPWMNHWMPWMQRVSNTLNKPIPNLLWVPMTPFVARNSVCETLLQKVDFEAMAKKGCDDRVPVSEFLLYAFFTDTNHPDIGTYGGGYQYGTLVRTLEYFETVRTFALNRSDLQDLAKKRHIESVFTYIGLDINHVRNAIHRTTV